MFGWMKVKEHEELVASYERRLAILLRDRDNMMQGIRTLDSTNLRRLIQLCHPDRHKSSKLSIEMTQMLVKMKDKA